jgi:hypothetical protein
MSARRPYGRGRNSSSTRKRKELKLRSADPVPLPRRRQIVILVAMQPRPRDINPVDLHHLIKADRHPFLTFLRLQNIPNRSIRSCVATSNLISSNRRRSAPGPRDQRHLSTANLSNQHFYQ